MDRTRFTVVILAVFCLVCSSQAADFEQNLRAALASVRQIQPTLQKQINEGQVEESNERLLAVFPVESRTTAQTTLLGNLLYGIDPKRSYALHKQAAQELPHEPMIQLEWAMEQHRAGEYASALAAYEQYSQSYPQFAPALGLAAECLIQLGRTKDAVARWQDSEKATQGTLETLESLVCEVHKDSTLQLRRATLRAKAVKGDVDAAVQLIALDGNFEHDWWNSGPQRTYLKNDLPLLDKLPANPRVKAAQCIGECLLLSEPAREEVEPILKRHGFLIDSDQTLPADSSLLSLMLGVAIDAKVITRIKAQQHFAERLLAEAVAKKDVELFNAAAYLSAGTSRMAAVEKQGWEVTGDPRFAAGFLVERMKQKNLKSGDPLLVKALEQFPDDSLIAAIAVSLQDSPPEKLLIQAIKAEFHHFSIGGGLSMRPSARPLRSYFSKLGAVLK